jgi:phosphoribosylformimino-5-aminoimidazole carboxamide ribotide isomerase
MKKIEYIPAIDLIDGQCVRLTQGDYRKKKVYHSDPVQQAKIFEQAGLRRLHLVDLDGARQRKPVNLAVLERIKRQTDLIVDFGGGIASLQDLQSAFAAGADMVTAGSIAVKQPEVVHDWLTRFSAQRIILGADVKDGHIAIHGWQQQSAWSIVEFIRSYLPFGIQTVICTDVSRDGMLQGPNFELYAELRRQFPQLQLIASGGVRQKNDLNRLQTLGVDGVIFGKAFYEGKISLEELREKTR